jgi:membrane-bound lytic murein transglycosylase D
MIWPSSTRRFVAAAAIAAPLCFAACGSSIRSASVTTTPPSSSTASAPITHVASEPAPAAAPRPVEDPVLALIATSDKHFKSGERELELGHVEAAKQEFDLAVSVLLESPYGARTEPRIREHFDRLVDRISAYEVKALAEGDGFTEKKYAPATIDELLAMSVSGAPVVDPDLKGTVESDLEKSGHDISIPLNKRVLSYVELFQGRLHDFLEEGMRRGTKYLPMIQNVFRAEGLPLDLAYVPLVESAFNPNALSRASAKGVWQFMRGTGIENGLRSDWYIDERSDPEKATMAAAKYLQTLGNLFNGDWHLALASYNGGPGRVQKAMKASRLDDFWKIADKPNLLPRETREYVPMILAAIVIARNPVQYGFDFEPEPAHAYEFVTLTRPVDLRRVAEWAETTIDEIQALNPELRRWTTPVGDESYALKVPMGTAEAVNARLQESADTDLASLNWYTVKKGETLATIARKLGVSRTDLAEANYMKATAAVATGRQLMVPRESTAIMAAQTNRAVPVAESHTTTANAVVSAPASVNSDRVKVIYQVKQGDTLASIARVFKTTVSSIQTWNRIAGTTIRTGDKLTVYAPARAN